MIDYLLCYASESEAMADLPAYVADIDGTQHWDGSCVIPGVCCYRITGEETVSDPELGDYTRPITEDIDGWYLIIARPERDAALEGPACMLIADRDSRVILHTITTPEDLATLHLEPAFAGSDYPFGAPLLAD